MFGAPKSDLVPNTAEFENEPLITLWGYCGAPSLEKAGYIIPEDKKD